MNRNWPELTILRSHFDGSARQRAQGGYFTRLTDATHRDLESYFASRQPGPGFTLQRITISGQAMKQALGDLFRMNITPSTMFPDLDGAAQDANMSHLITRSVFPSDSVSME